MHLCGSSNAGVSPYADPGVFSADRWVNLEMIFHRVPGRTIRLFLELRKSLPGTSSGSFL